MTASNSAAYYNIPTPSLVTFANPSWMLPGDRVSVQGSCIPVTVFSIVGTGCTSGCTRYTYEKSLGTTWTGT